MSLPDPPPAPARVSTGGAWLGVAIAARAAAGAVAHFVPLLMVAGVPLVVDLFDRDARAQEVPPEFMHVTDLWLDLAQILGPYARAAGGAGVLVGVVLFVAAGFLVRGSNVARRTSRVLLVLQAAHSVAAAVWLSSLALGPLADWSERYAKAITELQDALPGLENRFPGAFREAQWLNVAAYALLCGLSLALDATLFWLAGRGFARDWCAARADRSADATGSDRG